MLKLSEASMVRKPTWEKRWAVLTQDEFFLFADGELKPSKR